MTENVMATDALHLSDVSVAYGRTTVVSDISFAVPAGETFGLMGLNGAGKTTLIKSILGLRDNKTGTILLGGQDSIHAESRRLLAYLPERFDPPSFLSGMEFIRFSLSLYNTEFSKDTAREYASRLALDPDVLTRRVHTYSKGMRQKLGLMATLLTDCPLLILDEPMSGLDPLARARLKDVLREVQKAGRTIFLSSHILADMDEICSRVGVLHQGRIQYLGTPAGLREQTGNNNLERAFLSLIGVQQAA